MNSISVAKRIICKVQPTYGQQPLSLNNEMCYSKQTTSNKVALCGLGQVDKINMAYLCTVQYSCVYAVSAQRKTKVGDQISTTRSTLR